MIRHTVLALPLSSLTSVPFLRTAAVLYEYLLTFTLEVRQYWNHSFHIATALFFANRYLCLIHRLFLVAAVFARGSTEVCALIITENWIVDIELIFADSGAQLHIYKPAAVALNDHCGYPLRCTALLWCSEVYSVVAFLVVTCTCDV